MASVLAVAAFCASPAQATDAGTRITNVASIRYDAGSLSPTANSNAVTIVVSERLDVTLSRPVAGSIARGAETPIGVVIVNSGNGHEAFIVQVTGTAGPATVAIDRNGDGRYDAATDTLLADGRTPELAPGASLAIVVVADTSAVPSGGTIGIAAAAATGSGAPGTVVPGAGDGGGDAVVGATGAAATLAIPVDAASPPTLAKSQSVLAPDGSSQPVRGAIVTYVLDAGFPGPADDARVDDPVPAGTRYVAGSLRLDGAVLADPSGGGAIRVALGPVAAATTHRIQFQVQIQ